jgi:hypothetical protein
MVCFGDRWFYEWPIDRPYEWPIDRFDEADLMSATATLSNVFVFVRHMDRDMFFSYGLTHSRFSVEASPGCKPLSAGSRRG